MSIRLVSSCQGSMYLDTNNITENLITKCQTEMMCCTNMRGTRTTSCASVQSACPPTIPLRRHIKREERKKKTQGEGNRPVGSHIG